MSSPRSARSSRSARDSSSTAVFLPSYQALVPTYLDDPWTPDEGYRPRELDSLLAQSPAAEYGVELPLALREFYLALGQCDELMETEHFFFDPDELEVRDGVLMFLEDEAESAAWGFELTQASLPDPLVWRRTSGADDPSGQWICEQGTISEFILDLLAWAYEDEDE